MLSKNSGKKWGIDKFGAVVVLFLCLNLSVANDKENENLSVMTRGKSPCFRNEGAGLVIGIEKTCRKGAPRHSEKTAQNYFEKMPFVIAKGTP